MARTVRNVNFHTARAARRALEENVYDVGDAIRYRRNAALRLRGIRSYRSDKCQTAQIDSEGGYRLDTWSECPSKSNGTEATRKMRRAGKILAQRQLLEG
jgi:hypothetical protein